MHGVTKSITFPAKIAVAPDAITVDSTFAINRKDFEINYAGAQDNLIRDDVVLTYAYGPRSSRLVHGKVQGPKSKVQSSRSKVQSPKSKVQSPRSKVQGQGAKLTAKL